MQIQVLFLLFSFLTSGDSFLENKTDKVYTNVYHYNNNVVLKNFDGTTSTIQLYGNSASLINADGTQSTIIYGVNSSTLISSDGTSSLISHSGSTSSVAIPDGTRININHMQRSSTCTTDEGKHRIMHTFTRFIDSCNSSTKEKIDVLIHVNWIMQTKALATVE